MPSLPLCGYTGYEQAGSQARAPQRCSSAPALLEELDISQCHFGKFIPFARGQKWVRQMEIFFDLAGFQTWCKKSVMRPHYFLYF